MGFKLALNAWGAHHSTLPILPYRKFALVCEGGGQRGIFTAGVLDGLFEAAGWTIPWDRSVERPITL